MYVKKQGYVLINSIILIFFITTILILGAKISNMNIKYIKNYEIYSSFLDLKDSQVEVLNICNAWLESNSNKVINNMNNENINDIENSYVIPNENYIKLHYLKSKKIFKIAYGIKKEEKTLYCLYSIEDKEKVFIEKESQNNLKKDEKLKADLQNEENKILRLFPKRKV
ncbi:hypothetical protein [Clostridium sp.]|uniref:hypothetical protein n=1 Tax=Clostridium sp. TaxID=1506 RepID=UPI0026DC4254|nr:hypothetical protein [Clostridium sp.]MDO5039007.1 hypothetical protein [Clostridium sp.]